MTNVDDYRRAYAAELAREGTAGRAGQPRAAAVNPGDDDGISGAIALFRDAAQAGPARLAALEQVQMATFMGPGFDKHRPNYRDALRAVASAEGDRQLRATALEYLALQKDEVARQLLLQGIDDSQRAIVPLAKAVQLLGHDDHGVAVRVARRVVGSAADPVAREEAVRVLASDPQSRDVLSGILSDQAQPSQLRSLSASSLRALDPEEFVKVAQKIVVDDGEDDSVRASCLGALNHVQGYSSRLAPDVSAALQKLDLAGKSPDLRAAAARFLQPRSK